MTALQRVFFLGGQVGLMLLVRYFLQWITFYSTMKGPDGGPSAGMALFSAGLVGTTMLLFRVFDGAIDPVAGALSDGWVRKGKQRRQLLWYSFLIPPIGLALIFLPTHEMAVWLRWVSLLSGMFIFFVGYTFYAIPYWSLVSDYAQGDENNNRVLSTLLGAGILIATAVGFVISPMVVEKFGYLNTALIFAVPATLLMILPYYAQPRDLRSPEAESDVEPVPMLESLKMAFSHKRFVAVMVIFAGSQMSLTMMTMAAPFLAVQILSGTEGDVAKIMGPFLGVAIPFFLFTPWFSKRVGWQRAIAVASIALGVVYCFTGVLGQALIGTPMMTAMIIFGFGGPMVAVLLGLEGEAITACAAERGGDSVSIYFGVYNFVVKAMNGLATMIIGILADRATDATSHGLMAGAGAVRAMSFVAGGCLFLGVAIYYVLSRSTKNA